MILFTKKKSCLGCKSLILFTKTQPESIMSKPLATFDSSDKDRLSFNRKQFIKGNRKETIE